MYLDQEVDLGTLNRPNNSPLSPLAAPTVPMLPWSPKSGDMDGSPLDPLTLGPSDDDLGGSSFLFAEDQPTAFPPLAEYDGRTNGLMNGESSNDSKNRKRGRSDATKSPETCPRHSPVRRSSSRDHSKRQSCRCCSSQLPTKKNHKS